MGNTDTAGPGVHCGWVGGAQVVTGYGGRLAIRGPGERIVLRNRDWLKEEHWSGDNMEDSSPRQGSARMKSLEV